MRVFLYSILHDKVQEDSNEKNLLCLALAGILSACGGSDNN